jgi:hypothetical protein
MRDLRWAKPVPHCGGFFTPNFKCPIIIVFLELYLAVIEIWSFGPYEILGAFGGPIKEFFEMTKDNVGYRVEG